MKHPMGVGLSIGVVVGLILAGLTLGVGTHTVCVQGAAVGTGGPLLSPYDIAIAPPGGYVNSSWSTWQNSSEGSSQTSGGSAFPFNSSTSSFDIDNWTLYAERSTSTLGLGSEPRCPAYSLVASPGWSVAGISGCFGCSVLPATSGGIGQRVIVPPQFYLDTVPSVLVNGSYDSQPLSTVSFSLAQNGDWEQSNANNNLSGYGITFGEFIYNGTGFGASFSVTYKQSHFGVPIRFTNGTIEDFLGGLPTDENSTLYSGNLSVSVTMTYVLPAASSASTWEVFLPGGDSPYALEGLLFEQTAGPVLSGPPPWPAL
jgi:hypothetical protein